MAILQPPPFNVKFVNPDGTMPEVWQRYLLSLTGLLDTVTTIVNTIPGVNLFTVATQPALGVADVGYLGWVSDVAHTVRWDGSAWQWFDGDRPGRFADFAIAAGTGWALCDGSATSYLTVGGAALTLTSFTTPNLSGSPAYKKSAAAYAGTINAASGVTGTGTSGDASPVTDAQGSHTHPFLTGVPDFTNPLTASGAADTYASQFHTHAGTTNPSGSHTHTVNAHSHSVPALAVGSLDLSHLNVLPYVRR